VFESGSAVYTWYCHTLPNEWEVIVRTLPDAVAQTPSKIALMKLA
jgi:hypothetical protein